MRKKNKNFTGLVAAALVLASVADVFAISLPEFSADMRESYGMTKYLSRSSVKKNLPNVKVAILERGFAGAEEAGNLPEGTLIVSQYDPEMIRKYDLNPDYEASPIDEAHGRRVAQLVWAMTGMSHDVAPQLFLLNANGYTNFRRAVRYCIENGIDIILYAQSWEYGGNFDGKGFVNATVNEALDAGILWINAAGNYGNQVYNGNILSYNNYVQFSYLNRSKNKDKLFFTVHSDEKDVHIVAAWNDFSEDRDYQAQKDLDLYVYEWDGEKLGELVGSSTMAQVNVTDDEELSKREDTSALAREEIYLSNLRKDKQYAIMVRDVSHNFSYSSDKLRVIVQANDGVLTFDDHGKNTSEIMIPADNPNVIAVGDMSESSSSSPSWSSPKKPDVLMPPWVQEGKKSVYTLMPYAVFSDDLTVAGTSADSAIFAGIAAVLKANNPNLTRMDLIKFGLQIQQAWNRKDIEVSSELPETVSPESTTGYNYAESGEAVETTVVETYTPEVVTVYPNPLFVSSVGVHVVVGGGRPVLPPVVVPPPPSRMVHPAVVGRHRDVPPPNVRAPKGPGHGPNEGKPAPSVGKAPDRGKNPPPGNRPALGKPSMENGARDRNFPVRDGSRPVVNRPASGEKRPGKAPRDMDTPRGNPANGNPSARPGANPGGKAPAADSNRGNRSGERRPGAAPSDRGGRSPSVGRGGSEMDRSPGRSPGNRGGGKRSEVGNFSSPVASVGSEKSSGTPSTSRPAGNANSRPRFDSGSSLHREMNRSPSRTVGSVRTPGRSTIGRGNNKTGDNNVSRSVRNTPPATGNVRPATGNNRLSVDSNSGNSVSRNFAPSRQSPSPAVRGNSTSTLRRPMVNRDPSGNPRPSPGDGRNSGGRPSRDPGGGGHSPGGR